MGTLLTKICPDQYQFSLYCYLSSVREFAYDPFNDWVGRGCNNFFPVLGGDGTKTAPTEDIFDQPPGQMQ